MQGYKLQKLKILKEKVGDQGFRGLEALRSFCNLVNLKVQKRLKYILKCFIYLQM
jgi:hypothetical protein